MKITAKQFALSLFESVDGKSAVEAKNVIKRFVELLAKKNRISLTEEIISEFVRPWNEKNGIVEAEIASAIKLDKEIVKLLKSYIIKITSAKKVIIENEVNKNILGGVIIRYGDKILDGSLKTQLVNLKDRLVK